VNGKVSTELAVYVHEIGHTLGLSHASYMGDQYADFTDTMGYCCNLRCLSAPNTHKLRWTKPAYTYDSPLTKPYTITLLPNQYILITSKQRQEYTFIQFRVPKYIKYDVDLALSVNIYVFPFTPYAQSVFMTALTQKGGGWYASTTSYSVQLLQISTTRATVLLQPTNMLVDIFDMVKMPL
jgi:hypothetical protein